MTGSENSMMSPDGMGAGLPGRGAPSSLAKSFYPFQRALIRGLAVVLPPLLTIVLFIWAWNTIDVYILKPVESLTRQLVIWSIDRTTPDAEARKDVAEQRATLSTDAEHNHREVLTYRDGMAFLAVKKSWIPEEVVDFVDNIPNRAPVQSAAEYYDLYVQNRFLRRSLVLPAFLAVFVVVLYLVGKLLAVGAGRLLWGALERLINRIPIIRNVYSSVKQVTDFAFNQNDKQIKVTRIVAVQYPRLGIWSMGFVTGEGWSVLSEKLGEPMVNVLMPTSPMPATGFTICVPKSQTIDLNITMDQAIQYCVSCGVVVPIQERETDLLVAKQIAGEP